MENNGLQGILLYFLLMNLLGFVMMGHDKGRARKRKWRIPERTLLSIGFIGGACGMLFGLKVFRHKSKKRLFTVGLPIMIVIHAIIFGSIIF